MPIDTADYERAATEALGRPVKIGSANLSLIGGAAAQVPQRQLRRHQHRRRCARFPELDALLGAEEGLQPHRARRHQAAAGRDRRRRCSPRSRRDNFSVGARGGEEPRARPGRWRCQGPRARRGATTPTARCAPPSLRGPEALVVEARAEGRRRSSSTSAPPASRCRSRPRSRSASFCDEGHRRRAGHEHRRNGTARLLNGTLSGTANMRWGDTWTVDGVVTARNINAAVFAPALLSDGSAEGSGKFSMSGAEPAKLGDAARIDGSFTVNKGVLGSFDLARALQTGGKAGDRPHAVHRDDRPGRLRPRRGGAAQRHHRRRRAQRRRERRHRAERRAFRAHRRRRAHRLAADCARR